MIKQVKHYVLVIMISIISVLSLNVEAETFEINVQKDEDGFCYLHSIPDEIENGDNDLIINIEESCFSVCPDDHCTFENLNSLTINGNNSTIYSHYLKTENVKNIRFNNLTLKAKKGINLGYNNNFEHNAVKYINNKEFLNNEYIFDNVNFIIDEPSREDLIVFQTAKYSLVDCTLSSPLVISGADMYLTNTNIIKSILSGADIPGTNVYIKKVKNELLKRRKILSSEISNYLRNEFVSEDFLSEFLLPDSVYEYGFSPKISNNIFIYQESSKTIKSNINIGSFEPEFINTYEDSIGYDDIKDLPIEWKSENEGIAKIENGIIIPVSAGSVDLVGTRGNDIYTIHLTVEKETIPEKIDKMTIKVPITGSKIKAWVVIVSIILLGIIGVCAYILVRNKKVK